MAEPQLRRMRMTAGLRRLVREHRVHRSQLVQPLFVGEGTAVEAIPELPGLMRWTVDALPAEAERLAGTGIGAVLLFGVPTARDELGSGAWREDGVVQRAIRRIKASVPELVVIADSCLCEYTSHGHCGVLAPADGGPRAWTVRGAETLPLLARAACSQAAAGADIVAPSAMLDGMVGAIRGALDDAGLGDTPVLSYAVKYASAFYGPFRAAAGGTPAGGDRRSHQMDPANVREAVREALQDATEGADMLMVKPGLPCLDVVRAVREAVPGLPLAAYNVSGEYAMLKSAAAAGLLDERLAVREVLGALRRAGADILITYHAADAADWLDDE